MLNFCYLCGMKKKTTIDIIGESERTTLYSISFEMDGTTEFEKFVEEFENNAVFNQLNIRDMKNKQAWFNEKVASVPPEIMSEVQLSAGIIEKIDGILKKKQMTQRDLAKKLGKSEAVVSRWTTGFPNLTLRSIAQLSTALGEPLILIPK